MDRTQIKGVTGTVEADGTLVLRVQPGVVLQTGNGVVVPCMDGCGAVMLRYPQFAESPKPLRCAECFCKKRDALIPVELAGMWKLATPRSDADLAHWGVDPHGASRCHACLSSSSSGYGSPRCTSKGTALVAGIPFCGRHLKAAQEYAAQYPQRVENRRLADLRAAEWAAEEAAEAARAAEAEVAAKGGAA